MGALDEIQTNFLLQFINFFDCLDLLAEYEQEDISNTLRLFKKIMEHKEQIYIKVDEWGDMTKIECLDKDYWESGYDYITQSAILTALKNGDKVLLANYGLGRKCFLETAQSLGVEIPEKEILEAQSPDVYDDPDNPLSAVVKELQTELNELKKSDTQKQLLELKAEINRLKKQLPKEPNARQLNNYGKVIHVLLAKNGWYVDEIEPHNYNEGANLMLYDEIRKMGVNDISPQTIGNILKIAKSQTSF